MLFESNLIADDSTVYASSKKLREWNVTVNKEIEI